MTRIVVAIDGGRASALARRLRRRGAHVEIVTPAEFVDAARGAAPSDPSPRAGDQAPGDPWTGVAAIVVDPPWARLPELMALCDRQGIRIVAVGEATDAPALHRRGLDVVPAEAEAVLRAVRDGVRRTGVSDHSFRGRTIVVWGPHGAPGRSTVAALLAFALGPDRPTVLADADSHAPSQAISLGLSDEGPGFAAACRFWAAGSLDSRELDRISLTVTASGRSIDVLCGINRPSRWPELSAERVEGALAVCRTWADYTVVDVAAPLEQDEEIVSDLDSPRRHAATLAALASADVVIAVCGAGAVAVSRFVRGIHELREHVGSVPLVPVVNRFRPIDGGVDERAQVRRALDRFAGVRQALFLPDDPRSLAAASLQARPLIDAAPRSPLVAAGRRLAFERVLPALGVAPAAETPRARRPRLGRRSATA